MTIGRSCGWAQSPTTRLQPPMANTAPVAKAAARTCDGA